MEVLRIYRPRSLTPIGPSSTSSRSLVFDWMVYARLNVIRQVRNVASDCLRRRRMGTWSEALRGRLDLLYCERPPFNMYSASTPVIAMKPIGCWRFPECPRAGEAGRVIFFKERKGVPWTRANRDAANQARQVQRWHGCDTFRCPGGSDAGRDISQHIHIALNG